jgi:hypothetical protein
LNQRSSHVSRDFFVALAVVWDATRTRLVALP